MRVRKALGRLVLTIGALLLAIVVVAASQLLMSRPQLDARAPLRGLKAPVTVERDALGVVTIDADRRIDAYRALGFVHGQERFFEMDLMRRSGAGELSELFGARALPVDRSHRVHRFRARAHRDLALLDSSEQALLRAYSDGINQGLAALRSWPFPYLILRSKPLPWRAEDTALVVFAMYFDLQGGDNRNELARAAARRHLPPVLAAWLDPHGSEWDAALDDSQVAPRTIPGAADVDLRKFPRAIFEGKARAQRDEAPGSNNFAVGGALTGTGSALVANDMHLGLRVPNLWFRARLRFADPRAPGGRVDIAGATLPGTPAIVVGSNGHVAWGFTNSYGDWMDWVQVKWLDYSHRQYATANGAAQIQRFEERIAVHGGKPEILEVRETIWGPVMQEQDANTSLALAWTAHRLGAFNLGIGGLERAPDLETAMNVMASAGLPAQNFVGGDSAGHVGWTIAGRIPQRSAFDASVPADWSRSGSGWIGWVAPGLNPRVVDPPGERLWTANARNIGGADAALLGDGGLALGARARQIRDDLRAREKFSPRDMLAIQRDNRALFLQRWWQLLQDAAQRHPGGALQQLADASRLAPERASTDSVSYRLTRGFRQSVIANTLDMLTAPMHAANSAAPRPSPPQAEAVVWPLLDARPPHLLAPIYADWDALLERSARSTVDELAVIPGDLSQRTWGERNTSAINHPLGGLPLIGRLLNSTPEPLQGDTNMPFVQSPGFGASERFAVSPGHESEGYFHMPGGQSGHPLSPYYRAGHDDWVAGRASPFLPGAAEHTLRLEPAPR